ncbi:SDR family NAD(P)-dependent oxidoreductase [Shewanella intestini]|uniref:SDR family NAD(P)-dependent oxidoreductase n=1 Tax=Shewanella intestini TaxID=2017544 RepID=A0ABS5HXV4_9GAMM|nr:MULTISPECIES: SDR family NAD(P)-dependent oxidoreductase [Shewanella]MBR9726581.1 SDR family NAD(P)-dependent oxidoreductase [Shewanella intestini]MRG34853.1 SDR family NAD(P)-dependent oxidoreductase [Shewanella sp. XMDDZSB0408]
MNTNTLLITGASSGIGFAVANHYLSQGWQVIACGRNQQHLEAINGAIALVFDITDKQAVKLAANQLSTIIDSKNLTLKQVILNAGTCEYIDDVKHFDGDLFERVINTNVIAVGHCLAAFMPLLSASAQLGLMSSSATYLPFPRAQAYGASKTAVTYLAESLRVDLVKHDIGVSVIHPGFVSTPLTDKNDFSMPMKISAEKAANYIYQGMNAAKYDIHFPKRFTWLLKLVASLPSRLLVTLLAPKAR